MEPTQHDAEHPNLSRTVREFLRPALRAEVTDEDISTVARGLARSTIHGIGQPFFALRQHYDAWGVSDRVLAERRRTIERTVRRTQNELWREFRLLRRDMLIRSDNLRWRRCVLYMLGAYDGARRLATHLGVFFIALLLCAFLSRRCSGSQPPTVIVQRVEVPVEVVKLVEVPKIVEVPKPVEVLKVVEKIVKVPECPRGDGQQTDAGTEPPAIADTRKPDAGTELPAIAKPNTGKPDAGTELPAKPDTGKPDAGTELPAIAKPNTGKPDAGTELPVKPNTGKPDAGTELPTKPNTGKPDAGTELPAIAKPGTGKPDADTKPPAIAKPDARRPAQIAGRIHGFSAPPEEPASVRSTPPERSPSNVRSAGPPIPGIAGPGIAGRIHGYSERTGDQCPPCPCLQEAQGSTR